MAKLSIEDVLKGALERSLVEGDTYDIQHFYNSALALCKAAAREQKKICAERVMYKGKITKVEAWNMTTDELQDRCEEECLLAPEPTFEDTE